jgi:hypothetical protein
MLFTSDYACAQKISVLFVGNSFTYVNNMPTMLAEIAKSLGDEVETDLAAPGGYTFAKHANDPATLAKIKSRAWTYVVLQEQSQLPTAPMQMFNALTLENAVKLNNIIHAANPDTKTVFYETWGFENGDPANCKVMPDVCTYNDMQRIVDTRYTLLAQQTGALLARVGEAWWQVRFLHPEIELYASDGKHPSVAGSYLVACVFYTFFFNKPLAGASLLGVQADTANILQTIAQQVVQKNR